MCVGDVRNRFDENSGTAHAMRTTDRKNARLRSRDRAVIRTHGVTLAVRVVVRVSLSGEKALFSSHCVAVSDESANTSTDQKAKRI